MKRVLVLNTKEDWIELNSSCDYKITLLNGDVEKLRIINVGEFSGMHKWRAA
jgi:hypothetical protein